MVTTATLLFFQIIVFGATLSFALPIPSTMLAVHANKTMPCVPEFHCVATETVKTFGAGLGEIVIKVSGSSVNPSDVDIVKSGGGQLFGVMGVDVAGIVAEVGIGCEHLKVGDAVWGVTKGAYAEYVRIKETPNCPFPHAHTFSHSFPNHEQGYWSMLYNRSCAKRFRSCRSWHHTRGTGTQKYIFELHQRVSHPNHCAGHRTP